MKLSVVVPCYNEEKNIPLLLKRFDEVIKRNDVEVLFVNNGSTDNSQDVLDHYLPLYPFASTVRIKVNQGYGFGILAGLKESRGEFIGWTHADMQTDPGDVLRALSIIEETNGNRYMYIKGMRKKRSLFDNFFTAGMSLFETLYLRQKLNDINAQPNIFHREFYESWINPPWDFSLDLFVFFTASKMGLKIIRFPVLFTNRIHGHSNWNTGLNAKWKFIKRTIDFSLELKERLKK